ncbi:4-alpha-glucanotransferase [Anaeroselena agilis]|uniref:4-alpha-glucanotransferase n=1 Tax=Anaeroselena agilis TaxID=3063788 RepID=A0ABU3P206_9FIRM|nr:4-alpha-glucanotransferase [Selenomonadales bacterium 4137-cl]
MARDWLYHDSHTALFRRPFGAVACGTVIDLSLAVAADRRVDAVLLRTWREGSGEELIPMTPRDEADGERHYRTALAAPGEPGLVWYYFVVRAGEEEHYYGNNERQLGGPGAVYSSPPPSFQITVHLPGAAAPAWYKNAVVYQIFVDRFYNGNPGGRVKNAKPGSLIHACWRDDPVYVRERETGAILAYDFFGGNLAGVMAKLTYLKDLGVSALYFNPVFEAVSNHKYDTADYTSIDAMFGDNDLFRELCVRADDLGMAVILDGVFSHTGSDSIYFNKEGRYPGPGAYQSTASAYYPWYRFRRHPDDYESWWGVDALPAVDELEPSYQDFIARGEDSVVRRWLRLGAKGWRLDVADELPDEFIRTLRRAAKETDPEAVIIGEVWEDASRKVSYGELRGYFRGDELDAATNYPFRRAAIDFLLGRQDAEATKQTLYSLYENYPRENFLAALNLIGSHDVPRILTLLGGYEEPEHVAFSEQRRQRLGPGERELAVRRLKLLALWQMTFPGVPCVYYGDEAGLEGYAEPLNRRTFPWGREDAGLTAWYRRVIAVRNRYPVLQGGGWLPLAPDPDAFGYIRWQEGDQPPDADIAVVLLNRSERAVRVEVDFGGRYSGLLFDALDDGAEVAAGDGCCALTLEPFGGRVLVSDGGRERGGCGVLLHITSLPSVHGIGGLGAEARAFVDFLAAAGQDNWQILPLNPVGRGNSPYQSVSAFAAESLLIDIDTLEADGLLTAAEVAAAREKSGLGDGADGRVDYGAVRVYKERLFRLAFGRFAAGEDYDSFRRANAAWLDDYALYMALAGYFDDACWQRWPADIAGREAAALTRYACLLAAEIDYHVFLQYVFRRQWGALRSHARARGVRIIGDLPIFVAHSSSDVWANRRLFRLDAAGSPTAVAGVPPDYFSATGQLWGNPLYDWREMAKEDYRWWQDRLANTLDLVDVVRIDHFRGFAAGWAVPAGAATAEQGRWVKGPGYSLFAALERRLGKLPVIAEDLGTITPDVVALRRRCGFPGMKVLQFSFACDGQGDPAPLNCGPDTVVYTGTHDNDTVRGWHEELAGGDAAGQACVDRYLGRGDASWRMVELAYSCRSALVIVPMQDILGLNGTARMNRPGTVGGNWEWRCPAGYREGDLASRLRALAARHRRGPAAD